MPDKRVKETLLFFNRNLYYKSKANKKEQINYSNNK